MLHCQTHLEPREAGEPGRQRGPVSARTLLESQEMTREDGVTLCRTAMSHLCCTEKVFLLTRLIFRCPVTTDQQARPWSQGRDVWDVL